MRRDVLSFVILLVVSFMGIIMTGCEVDYYEPSKSEKRGSSLFGDSIVVPSNFDWATMRNVNVAVAVDDQYDGRYFYIVEVFDENPIFSSDAKLLAKGVAKKGQDFIATVSFPTALETAYVRQVDPTGRGVVKAFATKNDIASVLFYNDYSSPSIRSAELIDNYSIPRNNLRSTTFDYDIPESPTREYPTPSDAKDITLLSGSVKLEAGQSYVIPKGKIYEGQIEFAWEDGAKLYIEGVWNATSEVYLYYSHLFIQEGGEFNPSSKVSSHKSLIVVAEGGKFNKENKAIELSASDSMQIINNGLFNVEKIGGNPNSLYNYGEMNIANNLTFSSSNAIFVNESTLTVGGNVSLKGNSKLYNKGTMNVIGDLSSDSEIVEIINENILTVGGKVSLNGNSNLYNISSMEINSLHVNANNVLIDSKMLIVNTIDMNGHNNTLISSCRLLAKEVKLTSGVSVRIGEEALFKSDKAHLNNSSINLSSYAILEVNQELILEYNCEISGPSSGYKALARLKKVTFKGNGNKYLGLLQIECSDHPSNQPNNPSYELDTLVEIVKEGSSGVVIPSTDCNDGGNNNPNTNEPKNPVFPIIYDGSAVTYLFEDNWPLLGDYDMNDLVMDLEPTYTLNKDNNVTKLDLNITLRAAGATKRLAAGLQLDGVIPDKVKSVVRSGSTSGLNKSVFSQSNGLETGQKFAVIPLFDDVHAAFGLTSPVQVNTIKDSDDRSPVKVAFSIEFNEPLLKEAVSIEKFNLFIVNGGYQKERQEVHLPGFAPTDKADKKKFGTGDDNFPEGKYYTSHSNMIWALALPGSAKYATEWTSISVAYPEMKEWATKSGSLNKDWYKNPVQSKIYN